MKYLKLFEQFDDPFGEETSNRVFSGKYNVEGTFYMNYNDGMSIDKLNDDILGYHEFVEFDLEIHVVDIFTFNLLKNKKMTMIEYRGTITQIPFNKNIEHYDTSYYSNNFIIFLKNIIENSVGNPIEISDDSIDVERIWE